MELSMVQIIFAIFPESLLLVYVGLGLLGIKTRIKIYFVVTLIYTAVLVIIRNILHIYGVHTLFLCLLLILLIRWIIKVDWIKVIIASLLSFIMLYVGEAIFMPFIFDYLKIDMIQFLNVNKLQFFIAFYVSKIPLLIDFILIYFFDFSIVVVGESHETI